MSIYVRESYNFETLSEMDNFFQNSTETLFLRIHKFPISTEQITVLGIIYWPPQLPVNPFIEDLDKPLAYIEKLNAKIHIASDFNLDNLHIPLLKKQAYSWTHSSLILSPL